MLQLQLQSYTLQRIVLRGKVCAKFRCAPLRIKKAVGVLRELITKTRTRTTRVVFRDAFGSKNSYLFDSESGLQKSGRAVVPFVPY